jgi:hypothetical protein
LPTVEIAEFSAYFVSIQTAFVAADQFSITTTISSAIYETELSAYTYPLSPPFYATQYAALRESFSCAV